MAEQHLLKKTIRNEYVAMDGRNKGGLGDQNSKNQNKSRCGKHK